MTSSFWKGYELLMIGFCGVMFWGLIAIFIIGLISLFGLYSILGLLVFAFCACTGLIIEHLTRSKNEYSFLEEITK